MDKLKSILSPGHAKDDAVLYGNESPDQQFANKGAVAGEGSHFPISKSSDDNLNRTTTETAVDTASHRTPGAFIDDDAADAATTASIKSGVLGEAQSGPFRDGLSRELAQPAVTPSTLDKPDQNPHSTLPPQTPAVSHYEAATSNASHDVNPSSLTTSNARNIEGTTSAVTDVEAPGTGVTTSSKDPGSAGSAVGTAKYRGTEQTAQPKSVPQVVGKTTFTALGSEYSSTNPGSKTSAEQALPVSGVAHPRNIAGTTASSGPPAGFTGTTSGLGSVPSGQGSNITPTQGLSGPETVGLSSSSEPASSINPPESHVTETAKRLDPNYHGSPSNVTPASTLVGVQNEDSSLHQDSTTPSSQGLANAQKPIDASLAGSQIVPSISQAPPPSRLNETDQLPTTGTTSAPQRDTLATASAVPAVGLATTTGTGTSFNNEIPSDYSSTRADLKSHERTARAPVPSSDQGGNAGYTDSTTKPLPTEPHHSSARDTAILGGAAGGAGGFAVYEATRDTGPGVPNVGSQDQVDTGGVKSRFQEHDEIPSSTTLGGSGGTTSYDYSKGTAPKPISSSEITPRSPPSKTEDHSTQNKPLPGGAVDGAAVGAGGLAAYESTKHDGSDLAGATSTQPPPHSTTLTSAPISDKKEAKKLEKEHEKEVKKAERQHDKDVKKLEKEHDKDLKAIAKEDTKESKKAEKQAQKDEEKAVKKEEKEQNKQAAIIAKEHEKEDKKLEKQAKKEEEKAEKETGEKKPSLVHRLLHRHDDDKVDKEEQKHQEQGLHDPDSGRALHPNNPHDTAERSASNEVEHFGSGKTTFEAYQTTEGQNKLHKKHPPGEVLDQHGASS